MSIAERNRGRSALRAVALIGAAIAFGVVVSEIAAWTLHLVRTRSGLASARAERQRVGAQIPRAEKAQVAAGARRYVDMAYGGRYELHPYFGYTFFRGAPPANNHGFIVDHDYPYRKGPGECVIGIFGGSVAMQVVAEADGLREVLRPAFGARCSKITVLPFASGGWRQPQTFYAFAYYAENLDLAIVLDGYNDVVEVVRHQQQRYPVRYPNWAVYSGLAKRADSPYAIAAAGKAMLLNESFARFTAVLDHAPWRWSMLAHLVWQAVNGWYQRVAAGLRTKAATDDWSGIEIPKGHPISPADDYRALYERLTRESGLIAAERGIPFVHFVQPNQHDRGSKPLTPEEAKEALRWPVDVTDDYRWLERLTATLRARGIASYSLAGIFRDEPGPIYSDGCCHLNPRGLDLLGRAMGNQIIAAGLLR